jgi:hypothetical protein
VTLNYSNNTLLRKDIDWQKRFKRAGKPPPTDSFVIVKNNAVGIVATQIQEFSDDLLASSTILLNKKNLSLIFSYINTSSNHILLTMQYSNHQCVQPLN